MSEPKSKLELLATTVQVLSVVAGVVISALSFNQARLEEASAREMEAARPFYILRQTLYTEAVQAAQVLANPEVHTQDELAQSRRRFRELYIGELSMVEAREVESQMVALAKEIDPDLLSMNAAQRATYNLAHALRDTFTYSWQVQGK
ncbi:hypothetical protein [Marinobacterium sedimentorum]|uniref:hypothetical protein n=1 Tax=Marinobacterium sedimentorum TaxID=2927804 RepID=UPI0020C64C04|nr:hypothetical protein [Marinobacterium sedimentorum]MCP8688917.1 hypothetical protein [Marinobacterium sedimentorum]